MAKQSKGIAISVIDPKGGTGKTTTIQETFFSFLNRGLNVVMVDCDPQRDQMKSAIKRARYLIQDIQGSLASFADYLDTSKAKECIESINTRTIILRKKYSQATMDELYSLFHALKAALPVESLPKYNSIDALNRLKRLHESIDMFCAARVIYAGDKSKDDFNLLISGLRNQYELILIDTAGKFYDRFDQVDEMVYSVAYVSQLVIVPVGPSEMELEDSLEIIKLKRLLDQSQSRKREMPLAFGFCRTNRNTRTYETIQKELLTNPFDIPVIRADIRHNEIFPRAMAYGLAATQIESKYGNDFSSEQRKRASEDIEAFCGEVIRIANDYDGAKEEMKRVKNAILKADAEGYKYDTRNPVKL